MSVGAGFGALQFARRVNRVPPNPYDKTTIVNLFPREIREKKPTLVPGEFVIPAAPKNDFSFIIISPASWFREIDESQPALEIPVNSFELANSIVRDYCNGLVGCDMEDKMPGLAVIPGALTREEIIKNHSDKLEIAKTKQDNWFKELVLLADVLWARTQGNPLAITNDARLAAEMLNLKNKPWLGDVRVFELEPCPACGTMRNPAYPICHNCKTVVNQDKLNALTEVGAIELEKTFKTADVEF